MEKIALCCFSILFLLITGVKDITNTNAKILNDDTMDTVLIQNDDKNIEDIGYYIFNNLKLEWDYRNLQDILVALHFTEDYTIREHTVKNTIHSGEGLVYLYEIENHQYKLLVSAMKEIEQYRLESIEIKNIDKHYFNLFPYKYMEEYIHDNNFGEIMNVDKEKEIIAYIMRRGEDDRYGYCDLLFKDGILKSLNIRRATP